MAGIGESKQNLHASVEKDEENIQSDREKGPAHPYPHSPRASLNRKS